MKTILYLLLICNACLIIISVNAQSKTNTVTSANTALSNLTSPTSINQSLLIDKDNAHNIGSLTKAWKNMYLDSALYIGGSRFLFSIGNGNTATGKGGLRSNHGSDNTASGFNTLYNNLSGDENTAVGSQALYNNVNSQNTAIGYSAMYAGNGSINGTPTGYEALYNDAGYANTATGSQAMYLNTTGQNNAAFGFNALYSNTTGNNNIAIGFAALSNSTSLNSIVAIGDNALYSLDNSGAHCTAVGSEAGYHDEDGSNNTFLGYHSGNTVEQGSSNTLIGYGADLSDANYNNATALGNLAVAHASNSVRIGNSSVTSIGGYANWSNVSDGRIKKNIRQNVPGLAFINKLNPITYNLDLDAADKIVDNALIKDKDGNIIQTTNEEQTARIEKEQIVYTGFIAQDVEKAAKELNYNFSGVDAAKNNTDLYGLRYADFVVPLVKAVQELSKKNDSLSLKMSEFENLKFENQNLEQRIAKLEAMMNDRSQSTAMASASLSQNIPNPFSNSTSIRYNIPNQFTAAKIIIIDKNSNALKQINLSGNKGLITIDAATIASGAYQYSLYADGKMIVSKQMISIK